MIAPVADVAPGVVRFLDFPVYAFLGDSIGVVSIHGRGINELGDYALNELWVAKCQGLPVLEDVAPVALVRKQVIARCVLEFYCELIPGPAGVSVAASEPDGQVLLAKPLQLGVMGLPDSLQEIG